MSFGNIDVLTAEVFEFYNSKNASVIVAAMEKGYMHQDLPSVWLIEVQVSGRLLEHGNESKTMRKARIYHVKEPNLMRRVSWL